MQPQNTAQAVIIPSVTSRLVAANGRVAALDKAIIRHEHDTAAVIRFMQTLLREHDAIDADYVVEFEDKLLALSLSTECLSLARRTAVES